MTTFTDVFGNNTLPPSEYGYQALSISANTTLVWPYNTSGGTSVSKIIDLTATVGSLSITLPDATEVSVGEDFLVKNIGAQTVTFLDAAGGTIGTVTSGAAKYFYLSGNATAAGTWESIAFGVGTSSVDAASLVGYGLMALGSTLNVAHSVMTTATGITIDASHRAHMVNFTGGTDTLDLTASVTLGDNFFVFIRNSGTGTLELVPNGVETIDAQSSLSLQPSESVIAVCSGVGWYTVGYGRSTTYIFTQLVKDVSAAGTFTLSSAEASNKLLTFIGSPASAVTVIVPNIVSVYYILSSVSTAQNITVKTTAGTGVAVPQSQRIIAICDATNVYSAQSVASNTTISLVDGSVSIPSLNFSSTTNTGLYKYSTSGYGFAVNGVARYTDDGTTVTFGALTGLVKRTAGVESAAVAGLDYTSPTSKALTTVAGTNTITGTATGITGYVTGQEFTFMAAGANTGATTININTLGAKNIYKSGTLPLELGDIVVGQAVSVVYDGTQFQFSSGAGGGGAKAGGVIHENSLVISADYTLTTNKNGLSVGPITINSGVAVTIPSGARWVVL